MDMVTFIEYQSQRKLKDDESITVYVYSKNATLEKLPVPLLAEERTVHIQDLCQY